jgi:hypothetical protein
MQFNALEGIFMSYFDVDAPTSDERLGASGGGNGDGYRCDGVPGTRDSGGGGSHGASGLEVGFHICAFMEVGFCICAFTEVDLRICT